MYFHGRKEGRKGMLNEWHGGVILYKHIIFLVNVLVVNAVIFKSLEIAFFFFPVSFCITHQKTPLNIKISYFKCFQVFEYLLFSLQNDFFT